MPLAGHCYKGDTCRHLCSGDASKNLSLCLGSDLFREIKHAVNQPESERTERQQLLIGAGKESNALRQQAAHCGHAAQPYKRLYHQDCLETGNGNREASLARAHGITSKPPNNAPEGTERVAKDIRHHLCEDCLREVTGKLDVMNSHLSGMSYSQDNSLAAVRS